jgi:hypothetical protein
MVDLTDWGPRQAVRHLVGDLESYCGNHRDKQIDRAIRDFSERGRHERPDDATDDRVTILADYFGVPEEYFWNPGVVQECDREILGRYVIQTVREHYLNGFRRSWARLAPPTPMPPQWWTEHGMATVNQMFKDLELRPQIMEWFQDELEVITAMDDAMSRVEAGKTEPDGRARQSDPGQVYAIDGVE